MNGKAMPSLHPDSAESKSLKCFGTRFANFPLPTTDEARTGSVAVTQAAQQRDSSQLSVGINHQMNREQMSHPNVITGIRSIMMDFQCRVIYLWFRGQYWYLSSVTLQ